MEWTARIQNAIDYIEDNLKNETNIEEIARCAYSSPFHFQRVFNVLCDHSLAEYIRYRRLSNAAEELTRGNKKITDLAFEYGYESPESFSRAFTKFHGVSPTEAKKGYSVKSFSPLSVKVILKGGIKMDYRIKELDEFQIICKRKKVEKPQGIAATKDISQFWDECHKNGTTQKIISYFPSKPKLSGLLGVCFSSEMDDNHFPYAIGVEYDGNTKQDDDLEIINIPARTYAVFTSIGKMPEAFQETYHKIVTEFFPQSTQWEYAEGVELEVYPSDNVDDPNYTCEIWIAVKEK